MFSGEDSSVLNKITLSLLANRHLILSGNNDYLNLVLSLARRLENIPDSQIKNMSSSPSDLFIISSPDKTVGLDDIRAARQFISFKPNLSSRRLVFINHAEFLTREAAAGLLKVSEDSPGHASFILSAKHHSFILPTILSRFLVLSLPANDDYQLKSSSDKIRSLAKDFISGRDLKKCLDSVLIDPDFHLSDFLDTITTAVADNPRFTIRAKKLFLSKIREINSYNTNKRLQLMALYEILKNND